MSDVDYGESLCLASSDGGSRKMWWDTAEIQLALANYNAEKTKSWDDVNDGLEGILLWRSYLRCWSPQLLCYPQKDASSYAKSSC